ncbi:MAG: NAD-dependent DNA ligase LigA, partial [Synergistaceae bacterium]|nr:NAD-dependent DNA ligase LigA [Synergistaceae bacterium]
MEIFEQRIDELYKLIEHHADLYYNDDAPEISDFEYDELVRELKALEEQHPELARKDFLTHKVGGSASELFAKVAHDVPMLSLDNVFNPGELEKFFERIGEGGFVCEMKIDGLAVSLIYEDGIFVRGATRGNGHTGEDVTANLELIDGVPKRLLDAPAGRVEVRGEVLMTLERFRAVNRLREERGENPFANPRNAAAGTLRQSEKNNHVIKERGLDIFLYYLVDAEKFGLTQQSEVLTWLEAHGLPVQKAWKLCDCLADVEKFIAQWRDERARL